MKDNFYKFPSTPHLAVFPGVSIRNDKVFSEKQRDVFLSHKLVVEEKIDGANLGISFDTAGNIRLQNRGSYLAEPFIGQWNKLPVWLQGKVDALFDVLEDEFILFGEWCYAKHSIAYSRLPGWFLGFDILDKKEQKFLSVEKRNTLFSRIGIPPVPKLAEGKFTLKELQQLLSHSLLSSELAEGLYLRFESENRLVSRAKLVRAEFVQSIADHWSKSQIQVNVLRESQ